MSSAMDRLAMARAQRSQQASDVEMAPLPSQAAHLSVESVQNVIPTSVSQAAFLSEVASIQTDVQRIDGLVEQITAIHSQILNVIDSHEGKDPRGKLDELTTETRRLMQHVRDRIKYLESLPFRQNAQLRTNQIMLLRNSFLGTVQKFQRVEFDADLRSKQAIERKLRLVKPNATSEEIEAYLNDVTGSGQQVFTQALMTSTSYDQTRMAYREAEQRQRDIKRLEETLTDLTRLFNDMAVLVEQQEPVIQQVDKTAGEVQDNTQKALEETEIAVKHARAARKKKWICFGLFLLICAILALVLGLTLGLRSRK